MKINPFSDPGSPRWIKAMNWFGVLLVVMMVVMVVAIIVHHYRSDHNIAVHQFGTTPSAQFHDGGFIGPKHGKRVGTGNGLSALPDTTNNIHMALTFNGHESSQYDATGHEYFPQETGKVDYVWGATMQTSNGFDNIYAPGVWHTRYTPWSADWNAATDSENLIYTTHPDWLEYKGDKTSLAWVFGRQANDSQATLDFSNPAVQQYLLNTFVKPAVNGGYNGIAIDNGTDANIWGKAGHYDLSRKWVSQYDTSNLYSDSFKQSQARDLQSLLTLIHGTYPNLDVTLNQPYSGSGWSYSANEVNNIYDEKGFTNFGNTPTNGGNYVTDQNWLNTINAYVAYQRSGHGLILAALEPYVVSVNESNNNPGVRFDLQWVLANYLMVKYNHTYQSDLENAYGYPLIDQPEYHLAIGSPTTGMYTGQNVYWRNFSNGAVAVNPSSTQTYTVSVDSSYTNAYGGSVASVTMPPHSGLLMLKAMATPTPVPTSTPTNTPTPAPTSTPTNTPTPIIFGQATPCPKPKCKTL